MDTLLIRNASVVNEGTISLLDILIEGDLIVRIIPAGRVTDLAGAKVIDASGMYLFPGIIDDHVHFRDPGLTHKAEIATESAAAAAGGITSFMDMPNTIPQTTSLNELEKKNNIAAAASFVNYAFYLGATNDNITELRKADPSQVCGIKVFMGASTGNMLVDNSSSLNDIFSIKKIPVVCHCEDETIIKENMIAYREEYGDELNPSFHPLIRSRQACITSTSRAIELARALGTRMHLLHLTTAEEAELLEPSLSAQQKKITAEVCISHLWYDDSSYDSLGNLIKCNPAIKQSRDRERLRRALREGQIDVVATDHAPHSLEEKSAPYLSAPSGIPMIQHSLNVMMELYRQGEITLELIAQKMCHNPAVIFNIKDRGFIREGYKADIVIVNPGLSWEVSDENLIYKCGWSPLTGTTFSSCVDTTIVNGTIVYEKGKMTGKKPGEKLLFQR